ncbi:MAG: glycosyltransferase [Nanoarchaeota archaeon]
MDIKKGKADYLFEASWEVCNKVGGINTVLISKAALMREYYDNYFLVGPFVKRSFETEVIEAVPPPELERAFTVLKEKGITCYFGKWQIKGEPYVILVDFQQQVTSKNSIKTVLWDLFRIDSLHARWDFEEPMLWSWCVGMLLEEIEKGLSGKRIVAHFHEWLAGFSLLYLKQSRSRIKTIFTTHATMLGRSIASQGRELYSIMLNFDPEKEARNVGIIEKFTAERACAKNCDVFTTVSEITGLEAEKVLGRKPDILLLNGLDVEKFPTIEETSIKHVTNLEQIREFITYYFFPHYTFELEHTLIFFIIGRYEFKNKGIDVTIRALARLNDRLAKMNSKTTVCVFFWIPNATYGLKKELLENKNIYRQIKQYVDFKSKDILKTIVEGVISRDETIKDRIFTNEFILDLKKELMTFKRFGNPLIVTHYLQNEDADIIKRSLLDYGLDNKSNDRVKVILYPVYLDGNDGLLNLSYYEAMSGCHLGIFPSYYEPWGYTSLEAAAMGVASVTSDLTGFGSYIKNHIDPKHPGIFIVKRFERSNDLVVEDLARIMYEYTALDHVERVENKITAKTVSSLADWKHLVKNYIEAHNLALEK